MSQSEISASEFQGPFMPMQDRTFDALDKQEEYHNPDYKASITEDGWNMIRQSKDISLRSSLNIQIHNQLATQ